MGGRTANTTFVGDSAVSIEFDSTSSSRWILAALTHEMGHALGLEHTDEGVMRSTMKPATDLFITAENCRDVR